MYAKRLRMKNIPSLLSMEKRYLLIEAASVIFYIGILHHYRDNHL